MTPAANEDRIINTTRSKPRKKTHAGVDVDELGAPARSIGQPDDAVSIVVHRSREPLHTTRWTVLTGRNHNQQMCPLRLMCVEASRIRSHTPPFAEWSDSCPLSYRSP